MGAHVKTHFDHIASAYEKVPDTWKSVYDKVRELLEPLISGKTVLDIGNGGFFPYNTALPSRLIALDISPAMLERVKDSRVQKKVGDATNLEGFEDNSVDVILFVLSIHHINGSSVRSSYEVLDKVIAAAHRKLKKGGRLIVVEPTFKKGLFFLEKLFFWPARAALSLFKVSMVFFYTRDFLAQRIEAQFRAPARITPLPVKGFVDPLGGTFPGLIRIPASLSPTHYYFFEVSK